MSAPEKIGTLTTTETATHRDHLEYAAWFRDFECQPQTVDVYLTRNPEGWPQFICWGLNGTCVDAYQAGDTVDAVGTPRHRHAALLADLTLAGFVAPDGHTTEVLPEYEWLRDESKWPNQIADRFVNLRKLNKYDARCINIDFVRKNATPGLILEDCA